MKFGLTDVKSGLKHTLQRLAGREDIYQYQCPALKGLGSMLAFSSQNDSAKNGSEDYLSCCMQYDKMGWPYRFPECASAPGYACRTCFRASPVEELRDLERHPVMPAAAVAWAASNAVYCEAKARYGIASKMARTVGSLFGKTVSSTVEGHEMAGDIKIGMQRHDVPNMCPQVSDWEVHMLNQNDGNIHARVFKSKGAKLAVVAFRGTVMDNVDNMQVDADIRRTRLELRSEGREHTNTYVHEGFLKSLEKVLPQVRKWVHGDFMALAEKVPEDWTLVFAGHSLGGALALLAATQAESEAWERRPDATIIFGAPRIADESLDQWWRTMGLCKKLLRVNGYNDIIHWMPFVKRWGWWQVATGVLGCVAGFGDCIKKGLAYNLRSGKNETVFSKRWAHVCSSESEVLVPTAMKGVNEDLEEVSAFGGGLAHSIDNCLFGYGYGVLTGGIASQDGFCGLASDFCQGFSS